MTRISTIALALALTGTAGAQEKLADHIRGLDLKTEGGGDPIKAWSKDIQERRFAVNQADRKAWTAVQSKADWENFKAPRIAALKASLGDLPPPPKEIHSEITKLNKGDGFVVANLIYESRPGHCVTANLYMPENPGKKMPIVLIFSSHHNPKTQSELQDMGMTWARQGCLVLVPDQLGHGERRNHPFTDASKYPGPFKPGRQDYYFRYNSAMQLHLIGDSLIGWMAYDMSRGLDLLLSKDGVDKNAVILLGSVAGGGDPAAVTAAIDPRITAVCPFNFGGPQPETKFPLPTDADAAFNYMGGGSWESTRNLRQNGKGGFLPWVIVAAAAPRGLVYGHEFAWDMNRDPVWGRLQKIYGFYGATDHLTWSKGSGSVTGKPPEATHCNNIGPIHRKPMYPTFKQWFGMPEPEKEYQKRFDSADLQCWTDKARATFAPGPLHEVVGALGKERAEAARKRRAGMTPEQAASELRKEWAKVLGNVEPSATPSRYHVTKSSGQVAVETGVREDGMGSYRLLVPPKVKKKQPYPVVVAFAQAGVSALAKERADAIAELLETGTGVCLVELRGMGTKGDRSRATGATSLSSSELMLGETVIGQQLRELRELLALLRKRGDVDGSKIALWGDSLAKVNAPDRLLAVPLDADRLPDHAEPGAALLALLGGLFEPEVRAVYTRGGLASYQSILAGQFIYVPHDAVVPGALTTGDIPDVAAALAPRPVRQEAPVDGVNRPALGGAAPSSPAELGRWLTAALR